MEIWKIESRPWKQRAVSLTLLITGSILLIGFRNFEMVGMTNSFAGFLLGGMLVLVALAELLTQWRQTITVDPVTREIHVVGMSLWKREERIIPFETITATRVAFLGRRANILFQTYYVSLSLSDGTHYPLFFPAYFDGRGSKAVVSERCRRLEQYLHSS